VSIVGVSLRNSTPFYTNNVGFSVVSPTYIKIKHYMPRKIRELITDLEAAGFINRGGKGSHRNFVHPKVRKPITISGKEGNDAKSYQEKSVKLAIEDSKK